MKITVLLILCLFLISCQEENKPNIVPTLEDKEIVFETKLLPKNKIHYINNSKYISFYDFNSRKRIEVFTLDGKKIKSIDLSPLINKSRIISYDIISLDSIVLLSKYTNRVFLINDKCDILYEKNYSNLLLQSIELSTLVNFENNILKCGINFCDINFPEKPTLDDYIASNETKINFPMIFIDSNFFDSKNYVFHYFLESITPRFIKKNEIGIEGMSACFSDNVIYYTSAYSDSIYVINNQNELINVKSLQSKNFTLKPTKYKDFIRNRNLHNERYKKNGFIWSFNTNKSGTRFSSVFCKKSKEMPKPFTIIIYDKDFTVLKKIEPDPSKMYPFILMESEGYYLLQNKKDKSTQSLTFFPYD